MGATDSEAIARFQRKDISGLETLVRYADSFLILAQMDIRQAEQSNIPSPTSAFNQLKSNPDRAQIA